ncbi:multiple epidermal growth factor-like domains protein 10 [Haliotis asinina]|uniref:multiple epidermal growth factor-like domains protein 10 n=1 Tax=Haliotis asinina TaxID=109174 RepID=UPI003532186A
MAGVRTLLLWTVVAECWMLYIQGSCPAGKFGDTCRYSCHCGHSCNQTTGVCGGDCDEGWIGGRGGTCQKENIAYRKYATSSGSSKSVWSADKAVDGNREQVLTRDSCFHASDYPSVWTVDLGQQYRIYDVRIYNRNGYAWKIQSAVLSLSNSSSSTPGVPCYTFTSSTATDNSIYDVICDGTGQFFTIYHGWAKLNLCEVEIYVCSQGSFGTDCNHFCHCSDGPCYNASGICGGDCRSGWRGQNCSVGCDQDHYGVNCNETCSNRNCAANTSSCDRHTGSCDTGCLPGWTAVDCTQECFRGTYGQNCSKQCGDRNCVGDPSCHHVTGSCVNGCKAGWMGIDCVDGCDQDHYGVNCNETCSNRNCAANTSSCDRHTGSCDTGCLPGWTAVDCTQECFRGTYGQNCSKQCGDRNCVGDPSCHHVTGSCVNGCKAGWMGIDCVDECDQDHYGVNCHKTCESRNCAADKSTCDRHTGSCDTWCLPGWTTMDCTQECSPGTYGQTCSKQCGDRNCAGNSSCDHVTGSCVAGCKAGWMGLDCAEETRLPQGGPGYNTVHLAIAVAAAFVVGAVVSSVVCWRRKRRPNETSESNNPSYVRSGDVGPETTTYLSLHAESPHDANMTGETYCTIESANTSSEVPAAISRDVSESVGAQMYETIPHTSLEMNCEYSQIGGT